MGMVYHYFNHLTLEISAQCGSSSHDLSFCAPGANVWPAVDNDQVCWYTQNVASKSQCPFFFYCWLSLFLKSMSCVLHPHFSLFHADKASYAWRNYHTSWVCGPDSSSNSTSRTLESRFKGILWGWLLASSTKRDDAGTSLAKTMIVGISPAKTDKNGGYGLHKSKGHGCKLHSTETNIIIYNYTVLLPQFGSAFEPD